MNHHLTRTKNRVRSNPKECIRTLLISEGFGFCFSLSCVCGYRLDHGDTVTGSMGMVLANIGISLLLGTVIAVILSVYMLGRKTVITGEDTGIAKQNRTVSVKLWLILALMIEVLWLPIWLAYYPAVFSYDAEAQLYQVISGNYSTHHPLLHTLIMGACMKLGFTDHGIGPGMALYAGFQTCVLALILGWGIAELVRIGVNRKFIALYFLFLGLFPVHGILAISTTKDVLFSGIVVIFVLLCRRGIYENRVSFADMSKLCASALFLVLFRNNALYALAATILVYVCIGLCRKNKQKRFLWKMTGFMTIGLLMAVICGFALKGVLGAEAGSPREALSVPIQQIARTALVHGDEMPSELAESVNILMNDEAVAKYDEHLADPVKERVSMKQPGLFVKTWISLGCRYPGTFLDAWLAVTEGAWYIRDESCNRIYGEGSSTGFGYLSTDTRNMPDGFQVENASKLPRLREVLERLVSDNSFEKVPMVRLLFAPALYFWIFVWGIYKCHIARERRGLMLCVFEIFFFLTILLSPAILVRYMYPYMLAVFVPWTLDLRMGENGDNF